MYEYYQAWSIDRNLHFTVTLVDKSNNFISTSLSLSHLSTGSSPLLPSSSPLFSGCSESFLSSATCALEDDDAGDIDDDDNNDEDNNVAGDKAADDDDIDNDVGD